MNYSPLRYPGGKNKLSAFIAGLITENKPILHYIEPYSGGASVALFLLLEGFVESATINDKDRSIYSFWHSVLYNTNELCNRIAQAEFTVDEWRKQREIQSRKDSADLLDLGFSTFYLNRTNRSGIINGGVIGGVNQDGNYLMDCRFNKSELVSRILKIAERKNQLTLLNVDAIDLIEKTQSNNSGPEVLMYFDPPYFNKASSLYLNHYKPANHKEVSEKIKGIRSIKWIVSYDNVEEIRELYSECDLLTYAFNHTAHSIRVGKEILFFSSNLNKNFEIDHNPIHFKLIRKSSGNEIAYKPSRRSRRSSSISST